MRIVEISNCDDCPFFDHEYYDYNELCEKLGRRINGHHDHIIPDDCPLPKKTALDGGIRSGQ